MKNNYGYHKFEITIAFFVILLVSFFIAHSFFEKKDPVNFYSMRESAGTFSHSALANMNSVHDMSHVYLQELIDLKLIKPIKNPVSGGKCNPEESKVDFIVDHNYVTLKCGEYLIDKERITDDLKCPVYKVSEWSREKPDVTYYEEKELYNCIKDNKLVYSKYYEDYYLVYLLNKKYNTDYFSIKDIEDKVCKLDKKMFYRTKEVVNEN